MLSLEEKVVEPINMKCRVDDALAQVAVRDDDATRPIPVDFLHAVGTSPVVNDKQTRLPGRNLGEIGGVLGPLSMGRICKLLPGVELSLTIALVDLNRAFNTGNRCNVLDAPDVEPSATRKNTAVARDEDERFFC